MVNAEIAAKKKALLEVRTRSDKKTLVRCILFGDDESNINQVAEHPYVEKHIAAFLLSRRGEWLFFQSTCAREPTLTTARVHL